ncbi:UNVERIFIED_CONTAM: Beta-hexosaminidase 2 [Sesamum angustifolium]|uniref:beta-N-acetylhexosaminidase n=1 Tax=Sesamum angustifolium TaxID=2727405 RepID=A0AAW2RIR6_9LAMI
MGCSIITFFSFSHLFISTLFLLTTPLISAVPYPIDVWPKPTTFHWPHPQGSHTRLHYIRSPPPLPNPRRPPLPPPDPDRAPSPPRPTSQFDWGPPAHHTHHHRLRRRRSAGPRRRRVVLPHRPYTGAAAVLNSQTPWGAMRGLETFSQLVYAKPARVACGLYISDGPLFPHRGIMLDTSRNYYGVEDLLRLIRTISMNKLNVFHWHITDSHSFPLVPSEPEMAAKGAYGEDMKYTAADVKRVVEYGMEHGVRVVPEIDMPAHTGSWAEAYPEIVTCANKFWWPADAEWTDRLAAEPGTGQLNPLKPKTYEDVLFDADVNVATSLLPRENVILQSWNNGPNNTKRIVDSGYRAIVSSSDFYYLDCGHGDFTGNNSLYNMPPGTDQGKGGSWCGPFKTWQTIYNYDITYGLTEAEAKLVIGGEVALWSEQADSTVMDSRIWPRTSAMAEALWSGNRDETGKKRFAEATDRLNEWRYRMVTRGIGAEPIQPLWCIKNPGMCNTVHLT